VKRTGDQSCYTPSERFQACAARSMDERGVPEPALTNR
jgi:hypothetical protein